MKPSLTTFAAASLVALVACTAPPAMPPAARAMPTTDCKAWVGTDRNAELTGRTIYLLGDARDVDPFGRLLRYVFLSNGQSVDATLVAEGLGHAWMRDGRYKDQIVALESQARDAHRGCLWK